MSTLSWLGSSRVIHCQERFPSKSTSSKCLQDRTRPVRHSDQPAPAVHFTARISPHVCKTLAYLALSAADNGDNIGTTQGFQPTPPCRCAAQRLCHSTVWRCSATHEPSWVESMRNQVHAIMLQLYTNRFVWATEPCYMYSTTCVRHWQALPQSLLHF